MHIVHRVVGMIHSKIMKFEQKSDKDIAKLKPV